VRVLDAAPEAIVARTNFYGWGPSYRASFSDVIIAALRASTRLALFDDVTYTPIIMAALIGAVHDLVERKANGVFHVSGDDMMSKYQFGVRLARAFQMDPAPLVPASIDDQTGLVARPHRMGLSNRKATARLGRKIGGIDEHLAILVQQQTEGLPRELANL
jgi:dTDP-4-dehydrorhamnose reductase